LLPGSVGSVDVICWFIRCDHALIHASWVSSQFSSVTVDAGGTGERRSSPGVGTVAEG
jgi:hypothetical protein